LVPPAGYEDRASRLPGPRVQARRFTGRV